MFIILSSGLVIPKAGGVSAVLCGITITVCLLGFFFKISFSKGKLEMHNVS